MSDFGENIIEFLENQGDESINTYKETYQLPSVDETLDLAALMDCGASSDLVGRPKEEKIQESSPTCHVEVPSEAVVTKITKQLWEAPKTEREKLLIFVLKKEMNRTVRKIIEEHGTRGPFRFLSDFKSKVRFVLRHRPY